MAFQTRKAIPTCGEKLPEDTKRATIAFWRQLLSHAAHTENCRINQAKVEASLERAGVPGWALSAGRDQRPDPSYTHLIPALWWRGGGGGRGNWPWMMEKKLQGGFLAGRGCGWLSWLVSRSGLVWSGLVWSGLVWFGLVWSFPPLSSPLLSSPLLSSPLFALSPANFFPVFLSVYIFCFRGWVNISQTSVQSSKNPQPQFPGSWSLVHVGYNSATNFGLPQRSRQGYVWIGSYKSCGNTFLLNCFSSVNPVALDFKRFLFLVHKVSSSATRFAHRCTPAHI